LKVFADDPEKIPLEQRADVGSADVIILFNASSIGQYKYIGKPIYFVGKRLPLSLAKAGTQVTVINDLSALGVARAKLPEKKGEPVEQLSIALPNTAVSFSPGTNVGKTFFAANLAAWQARRGRKTVLMDLDIGGSGTWETVLYLPREPEATLSDWNGREDDLIRIVQACRHHRLPGLYFLQRGPASDAKEVRRALEIMDGAGYYVVVDTSNNQEIPYINAALQSAGKIFMIGVPNLKEQARMASMYATITANSPLVGKMALVVNRVGAKDYSARIRPEDLARQFLIRNPYVVHENFRAREQSRKKKTLPVLLKSPLSKELETVFQTELQGTTDQGKTPKNGFLRLRRGGNKLAVFFHILQ